LDEREAQKVPDDSELLNQIQRGDQAAFRALLERHARYLFGIAHSLAGGSSTDAEDLVQETLIGALTGHFRGESSVRTWLVRILVNRAAMLRRSRSRKPETLFDPAALPASASASSRNSTTAGVEAKLDLTTMLAALSPEHRQVIVLRELEGMTYDQIAAALSVPRGTVESRLHRAREELRKRFKGYGL
jgi:RNA polymerase sigma-70 factor (ECF subfamily)